MGLAKLLRFLVCAGLALTLLPQPCSAQADHPRNAQNTEQPNAQSATSQPRSPETQQHPDNGGGKKEDDCRYGGPQWFARFYCFFAGHEKFWVSFGTLILAAATAILGFATVFLWNATKALVRGADKNAERQLRAYVHVTEVRVSDFLNVAEFSIQYENRGQTPAYDVRVSNCIALERTPVRSDLFEQELGFSNHGTLGPGGLQTHFTKAGPRQLTEAELAGLADGSLALLVFGEIKYRDAFSKHHVTRYRNVVTRDANLARGGRIGMAEYGNEAD
jgi:hypothetical protein